MFFNIPYYKRFEVIYLLKQEFSSPVQNDIIKCQVVSWGTQPCLHRGLFLEEDNPSLNFCRLVLQNHKKHCEITKITSLEDFQQKQQQKKGSTCNTKRKK